MNNGTGLRSSDDCALCPYGYYCATDGLFAPSGPCSGGSYCTLGSTESTPSGVALVEILWLDNV
eukprot:COSAG02_NODE_63247_length_263_cov_1.487805_1_plen_63_part_01